MSKHRGPRSRRRAAALVGAVLLSTGLGVATFVGAPSLRSEAVVSAVAPSVMGSRQLESVAAPVAEAAVVPQVPALPADSGEGRRVVFDQGDQRVWLVDDEGSVARSYLVSGSRFDNLDPGSYAVLSRTRHAVAFDHSGTMEYFVRFATGYSEPIGFHSVPKDNSGRLEQTKAQLGTPLSAGCVRQWEPDAVALWDFAPVGTPVVVTA